jgi:LysR family glycine cleavage system transcriptional activator
MRREKNSHLAQFGEPSLSSRLPPLNPLRAFEATARRGSVSAAARELNVTHGAVSHQIRALELSFNVSLFVRGGKRLILTPQGALLLPAVTHAFEEIAAATAAMTRPTTSGQLRFACVPALLSFWMIPRLHEFTDQYPDISLTLIASNDLAQLYSPDVDLCLLWQWRLAGPLVAALESAGAVSRRQPGAVEHAAPSHHSRSQRSRHSSRR